MADCTADVEVIPPVQHQVDVVLPVTEVEIPPIVVPDVEVDPAGAADVEVLSPTPIEVVEVPFVPSSPGALRRIKQPLDGAVDGVNTVFTVQNGLKFAHDGINDEELIYNGFDLVGDTVPGLDYTISESGGPGTGFDTITTALPPKTGDILRLSFTPV